MLKWSEEVYNRVYIIDNKTEIKIALKMMRKTFVLKFSNFFFETQIIETLNLKDETLVFQFFKKNNNCLII